MIMNVSLEEGNKSAIYKDSKKKLEPAFSGGESGRTFSHIFGATTGPLEHFLTKRDIMGPCWLDIADAKFSNTSVSRMTV